MKIWRIIGLAAAAAALASCASMGAPGPFQGAWTATASMLGACNYPAIFALHVDGTSLTGHVTNSVGVVPLTGVVDSDGSSSFKIEDFAGHGKFTATSVTLDYAARCGPRVATGSRAG